MADVVRRGRGAVQISFYFHRNDQMSVSELVICMGVRKRAATGGSAWVYRVSVS